MKTYQNIGHKKTTKKQELIAKIRIAEKKVAEHRGVEDFAFTWKDFNKQTASTLELWLNKIEGMVFEENPVATDKQINFVKRLLAKDYNSDVSAEYERATKSGKRLNKWQASSMIETLLTNEDYASGRFPHVRLEDFEMLANKMSNIIAKMR